MVFSDCDLGACFYLHICIRLEAFFCFHLQDIFSYTAWGMGFKFVRIKITTGSRTMTQL